MLKIEFNHTDYEQLLQHFAEQLNARFENNVLHFPPEAGKGFMKLVKLPNGLQCILTDLVVHQDIELKRTRINKDFYMLRFDEVTAWQDTDENNGQAQETPMRTAVFLANARFEWLFRTPKNTHVKGIDIIFPKEWLEQFIDVEAVGDIIKKYLSLKMSAYNHESMDMEYKRLLMQILQPGVDAMFENAVIQNRLMLLLEIFFTRTYRKINETHFNVKTSNHDIQRIKNIEKELTKSFLAPPPSIESLAQIAAMSPSKLKSCFKEMYGLPIYQYFQKKRMNKAKAMLLSRNHNVREVGAEVGYSNLSNFAKAFKKSFDQLPSDLLDR